MYAGLSDYTRHGGAMLPPGVLPGYVNIHGCLIVFRWGRVSCHCVWTSADMPGRVRVVWGMTRGVHQYTAPRGIHMASMHTPRAHVLTTLHNIFQAHAHHPASQQGYAWPSTNYSPTREANCTSAEAEGSVRQESVLAEHVTVVLTPGCACSDIIGDPEV